MKSGDPNFEEFLPLLLKHQVKFILIGGGAGDLRCGRRRMRD